MNMQNDTKARIGKMLYHLSSENRAGADAELKTIIKMKTQALFEQEYAKVQSSFSKENK